MCNNICVFIHITYKIYVVRYKLSIDTWWAGVSWLTCINCKRDPLSTVVTVSWASRKSKLLGLRTWNMDTLHLCFALLFHHCKDNSPMKHSYVLYYQENLGLGNVDNACRNPNGDPGGPWCYIDRDVKEYCHIPFCREYLMITVN